MTDALPADCPLRPSGLTRRHALTGAAAVGIAVPTLAACGGDDTSAGSDPSASAGAPSSSAPASSADSGSAPAASGFATTADIPEGGGAIFGDEGVVVTQPTAGTYKGFTNICTHQGCPVAEVTTTINCNCHGSQFSIEDGSNVKGPNGTEAGSVDPLDEIELTVTGDAISKA